MSDSVQRRWKVLSLVLLLGLIVSLTWNVYSTFFVLPTESHAPFEFNLTWSSDSQQIVNGSFRLGIKMWIDGDNVTMVITANDDDYNDWDYVGLAFDINQNGYIDVTEESFGTFACNKTGPSHLTEWGWLAFAQVRSKLGPQNVTFDSDGGYVFAVQFPFSDSFSYDPAKAIKEGSNQLHICFADQGAIDKGKIGYYVFGRVVFFY